jgi:C1A family cysteine protease
MDAALPLRAGFVPPPVDLSHLRGEWQGPAIAALPSRFDWRMTGKVSPVKNQGACNACYAFASIAALESRLLIDNAGLWDFSENNVKECNCYPGRQLSRPKGRSSGIV